MQYSPGTGYVASYLGLTAPPPHVQSDWWTAAIQTFVGNGAFRWDLGAFGVALFFLISGFVIPFSLSRSSRTQFVMARILRIYPVYIASLALFAVATCPIAIWAGEPSRSSVPLIQWFAQATLIFDMLSMPILDIVSWTLLVELKFYLVCIVLASSLRKHNYFAVLMIPIITLAMSFVIKQTLFLHYSRALGMDQILWPISQLSTQLGFVCFIFCGYFVYLHRQAVMRGVACALFVVFFWSTELLAIANSGISPQDLVQLFLSQLIAMLVFVASYVYGARFRANRFLDWLAAISYPLYTTHLLVGWGFILILDRSGLYGFITVALAVLCVLLFATILHRIVERPCLALIEKLKKGGTHFSVAFLR